MTEGISIDLEKRTTGRTNGDSHDRGTKTLALVGALVRSVDRLSPTLGARLAARIFLTPRRARLPERERAWLESARSATFEAGRFRLAGHHWGSAASAEPVLLVHGWEGRGSQLGGLALALAAQGFRPITIDLPAHGETRGGTFLCVRSRGALLRL